LVIAAEAGCVENVVKGRVKLPSDPGPFSEDVSLGDFVRGFVPFLAFSDWVGGEVSLYFLRSYRWCIFCFYILAPDRGICVMMGFRFPAFG
jgi:hypothetical protein